MRARTCAGGLGVQEAEESLQRGRCLLARRYASPDSELAHLLHVHLMKAAIEIYKRKDAPLNWHGIGARTQSPSAVTCRECGQAEAGGCDLQGRAGSAAAERSNAPTRHGQHSQAAREQLATLQDSSGA